MVVLLLLYLVLSTLLVQFGYSQSLTFGEAFYFNLISYSTIGLGRAWQISSPCQPVLAAWVSHS
jgi:hypothetical protein